MLVPQLLLMEEQATFGVQFDEAGQDHLAQLQYQGSNSWGSDDLTMWSLLWVPVNDSMTVTPLATLRFATGTEEETV